MPKVSSINSIQWWIRWCTYCIAGFPCFFERNMPLWRSQSAGEGIHGNKCHSVQCLCSGADMLTLKVRACNLSCAFWATDCCMQIRAYSNTAFQLSFSDLAAMWWLQMSSHFYLYHILQCICPLQLFLQRLRSTSVILQAMTTNL